MVSNRTPARAAGLVEKLAASGADAVMFAVPLEADIAEEAAGADVIINTTYLGMKSDDKIPVPAEYLKPDKVVCDAVYLRGAETALIRRAREVGATVVPGGRMLLYQGVQAQRAWTGREPNVEVMSNVLAQ